MAIDKLKGFPIEALFSHYSSLCTDYLEGVLPLYKAVTVEAVPCAWVAW
jgi:hypothetical protein